MTKKNWSRRGFLKFMTATPALASIGIDLTKCKHIVEKPIAEPESPIPIHESLSRSATIIKIDGHDYTHLLRNVSIQSESRPMIDFTSMDSESGYSTLIPSTLPKSGNLNLEFYADSELLKIEMMDKHQVEIIPVNLDDPLTFEAWFTQQSVTCEMDGSITIFIKMKIEGPVSIIPFLTDSPYDSDLEPNMYPDGDDDYNWNDPWDNEYEEEDWNDD
jgi:hypothetical protein